MTLRRHRSACRLLALPVDGVRYMQARTHNPLSTLVIQVFNKLPASIRSTAMPAGHHCEQWCHFSTGREPSAQTTFFWFSRLVT